MTIYTPEFDDAATTHLRLLGAPPLGETYSRGPEFSRLSRVLGNERRVVLHIGELSLIELSLNEGTFHLVHDDRPIPAVQLATAWRLAAAHGHHWCRVFSSVELTTGGWCFSENEEPARFGGYSRHELNVLVGDIEDEWGGVEPCLGPDGIWRHVTSSRRCHWEIAPDGTVSWQIQRGGIRSGEIAILGSGSLEGAAVVSIDETILVARAVEAAEWFLMCLLHDLDRVRQILAPLWRQAIDGGEYLAMAEEGLAEERRMLVEQVAVGDADMTGANMGPIIAEYTRSVELAEERLDYLRSCALEDRAGYVRRAYEEPGTIHPQPQRSRQDDVARQ